MRDVGVVGQRILPRDSFDRPLRTVAVPARSDEGVALRDDHHVARSVGGDSGGERRLGYLNVTRNPRVDSVALTDSLYQIEPE